MEVVKYHHLMRFCEFFKNQHEEDFSYNTLKRAYLGVLFWTCGKPSIFRYPRDIAILGGGMGLMFAMLVDLGLLIIPLATLEMGIAQFCSGGIINWEMAPMWEGICLATLLGLFFTVINSSREGVILLYYSFQALVHDLPWSKCMHQWNSTYCITYDTNRTIWLTCEEKLNRSACRSLPWITSAESFAKVMVLPSETTLPEAHLLPYQIVVVLILFFYIRKSIISIEAFYQVLLILPVILNIILFFSSCIQPGASRGLDWLLQPKFDMLTEYEPYRLLLECNLQSLGLGLGGFRIFASQNQFRHPVHTEAIIICLLDLSYTIFYSIFTFNVIGVLSYQINIPIEDIIKTNQELFQFVQVPSGLLYFKNARLYTVLLYVTNFLLVMKNLVAQSDVFLMFFYELNPPLRDYTNICAIILCCIILSTMVGFVDPSWYFNLMLARSAIEGVEMNALVFFETLAISYFYGVHNFVDDMHFMLGFRPNTFWQFGWYIDPVLFAISFVCSVKQWKYMKYTSWEGAQVYVFFISAVLYPIFYAIYYLINGHNEGKKIRELLLPTNNWGPTEVLLKKSREMFSAHAMTKEYVYRQQRLKGRLDFLQHSVEQDTLYGII